MGTHGSVRPQTRQCRLYLLACARRQWNRLPFECRVIVGLGEVYADAPNQEEGLRAEVAPVTERLMNSAGEPGDLRDAYTELAMAEYISADLDVAVREACVAPAEPRELLRPDELRGLAALLYLPFLPDTPPFTFVPEQFHSVRLLHEVYGNPCQFVPFEAQWRTDTVLALARTIYESREFGGMPILADALQDAGCDNDEMLKHCRNPNQRHVRGCWVLDQVLGK
jgi:hypothetical protein